MRALTQRMLRQAGYNAEDNPAIAALADFAAQRSGIEAGNYFQDWRDRDGRRAYQEEIRDISADLRRFREALNVAASEGVTDADVIAEAPHAFSGRLTWKVSAQGQEGTRFLVGNQGGAILAAQPVGYFHPTQNSILCFEHAPRSGQRLQPAFAADVKDYGPCPKCPVGEWEYCTGQYFCTEYRKAAACVLEAATRRVRQARPPKIERVTTIRQLKALNERNGGCWFERSSMRFFGTRIESEVIRGRYFITSEQPPDGERAYSVRSFDDEGSIDTVGEFCGHATRAEAFAAIPQDEAVAA